jgi:LuxR family maltose regulon positive regulatory protein
MMPTSLPLLSTKLFIPKLQQNIIHRPHLTEKIIEGLKGKVTLISAPAGFGKTTLLNDLINNIKIPVAFLSLEKSENDFNLFLSYVIAALATIKPGFGEITAAIINSQYSTETLINTFVNEISSILPTSVLILDDFHFITSEIINKGISYFLEHFPKNLHIIFVTRTDPPFSLAKLRVSNQITEIRTTDLKFSRKETTNFFNEILSLKLTETEIEKLETKTEGWIAGIQLAGLAMKGNIDKDKFIKGFTGNNTLIADYLTDEVLQNLPPAEKDFLLQTSILNKLTPSLCNAVTGRNDSTEILAGINNANLFLIPLDDNCQWYRYHQLFRDLLQDRLRQVFPDLLKVLHQRAGYWYVQNGLNSEAFNHALEGGSIDEAAKLADSEGIKMLLRGEINLLKSWIDALPRELTANYPYLCICLGWINCLTNQLEEVESYIESAEKLIENEQWASTNLFAKAEIRLHIDLLRAYFYSLYHKGDKKYFKYCIDLLLKAKDAIPKDNIIMKSSLARILGGLYTATTDWEPAFKCFNEGKVTGKQANNHIAWLSSTGSYAQILILRGKLREAFSICQDIYQDIPAIIQEDSFLPLGFIYIPLAEILYEWNKIPGAVDYLNKCIIFAGQMENKYLIISASLELALIQHRLSNKNEALSLLNNVQSVIRQTPVFLDMVPEARLIRLWLLLNFHTELNAWMGQYLEERENPENRNEYKEINLARILMARNKINEAGPLLEKLILSLEKPESGILLIEALVLRASALWLSGNNSLALETMKKALILAEPEDYLRTFVDEGKPVSEMLSAILQKAENFSESYIIKILELINKEVKNPAQPLVDPLSQRELEILRFLATGITNKEIADKLFLATGTVKKHTNAIYSKLNVSSRTQAIQKAKELDFI